ncbi:MAG: hypothetical protein C4292_01160 [Nitrososphaera sp.]
MSSSNSNNGDGDGAGMPPITWFGDFMGVGYRYHDVYMNVFPLFEDKMAAFKLWKKTIDWWPDDRIKISFIEEGGDYYWFILYGGSDYTRDNTGFVKKMPISENYQRFKAGFEKKATLRFGIYKENTNPKNKDRDGQMKKYDLEILKKSKYVYDITFRKIEDLATESVEWQCIQQQNRRQQKQQP